MNTSRALASNDTSATGDWFRVVVKGVNKVKNGETTYWVSAPDLKILTRGEKFLVYGSLVLLLWFATVVLFIKISKWAREYFRPTPIPVLKRDSQDSTGQFSGIPTPPPPPSSRQTDDLVADSFLQSFMVYLSRMLSNVAHNEHESQETPSPTPRSNLHRQPSRRNIYRDPHFRVTSV